MSNDAKQRDGAQDGSTERDAGNADRAEPKDAAPQAGAPKGDRKDGDKGEEGGSFWSKTQSNLRTIVGAVMVALFIRMVLVEPFQIEGPSMEPTLLDGDRVIVSKYQYGLRLPFTHEAVVTWGTPARGRVVIATSPADQLDVVKRVIGIPGDRVVVEDDQVSLNGRRLPRSFTRSCGGLCEVWEERLGDHVYHTSRNRYPEPQDYPYGDVTVPPGHVYLLGDHRDRSNDSRFFGPVAISRIKGTAVWIYLSHTSTAGTRWDRMGSAVE
ncbi:MAG: signal peptidase I [Deltaproteobacteria bacterium]|nr:signal peptidase I [Deltaproteobacteria bacterium]